MRLVFAGTPLIARNCLEILDSTPEIDLIGVLSQPDVKKGRGSTSSRQTIPSEVSIYALERDIPLLRPISLSDATFLGEFSAWEPDCVAVVAYGKLIPSDLLSLPKYGWVNLHFSLLPQYRGASPVQAAIMSGETITGASTFIIDTGMDTGPVIGTVTETIAATDTTASMWEKLAVHGGVLLRESLIALTQDKVSPVPQDNSAASYAPKITPADAHIPWDSPSFHIDRFIRALTPAPGAWTEFGGQRIKLGPISLTKHVSQLPPGSIELQSKDVLVNTQDYSVKLQSIQPAGKKFMDAFIWWKNHHMPTACFV